MIIRIMQPNDFDKLKDIHEQFFSNDFTFQEFIGTKWLDKLVVEDDKGDIIVAGGVRLITETIALTDLSRNVKDRRQALLTFLEACKFITAKNKFEGTHAFVDQKDENWVEILKKYGFQNCKNQALYLQVL